jgi:hypothetical protein
MPIPLHGFLQGDTIGLLILADEGETVQSLARKLQRAASVRVRPDLGAKVQVLCRGRVLAPALTLTAAGLTPLDRFDVVFEGV